MSVSGSLFIYASLECSCEPPMKLAAEAGSSDHCQRAQVGHLNNRLT